jgi:hypothetical protein
VAGRCARVVKEACLATVTGGCLSKGVGVSDGLELASVLRQLRRELNDALGDAEGERLRFELGPIELSLSITLGRDATPGAKVRFWVVEAGVNATLSHEAVQKIKLTLTPKDTKAPLTSTRKAPRPLIKGQALEGEL